jgi:hypothetical protein
LYLPPSRWQVDSEAAALPGTSLATPPWAGPVQAICDYVHRHIRFDAMKPGSLTRTRGGRLARSNVPRLYPPGHRRSRRMNSSLPHCAILGDIGIPPVPYPMDFSAPFEAFFRALVYNL